MTIYKVKRTYAYTLEAEIEANSKTEASSKFDEMHTDEMKGTYLGIIAVDKKTYDMPLVKKSCKAFLTKLIKVKCQTSIVIDEVKPNDITDDGDIDLDDIVGTSN